MPTFFQNDADLFGGRTVALRTAFAVARRFLNCKYTVFVPICCRISRQRLRNGMILNGNGPRLLYEKWAERKKTRRFSCHKNPPHGPDGVGGMVYF